MTEHTFKLHPDTPFPVGVEYYRGPIPKQDVWDDDLARISAAGFRIVRSFSYWNHMEPSPGKYEMEDFDRLFDLAGKHGLKVWIDMCLATHATCPEWLLREYPDMRSVSKEGIVTKIGDEGATPQGVQMHCYDHPVWREYGLGLLSHVVNRYKDRDNLLIWGLWDYIALVPAPWPPGGSLCYCEHTLAKYKGWLRTRFTLDTLNERLIRRYRRWEDVEPPRSDHQVVEMRLFRQFHYENLADQLKWMVGETKKIDPHHEVRAHAGWMPRPMDEQCARQVDGWGMSMQSNELLNSDDPYKISERAFGFDWSRSVGTNGRWWNEEIYAGGSPARGPAWRKQSDPRELTTLVWMTLAGGAAGAMFWQYRPEYLSFESPGYSLVSLDGEPTPRFEAASRAAGQIHAMRDHLPLECPKAEVGIVYDPDSQDLFGMAGENDRFLSDLRGVYRTLWTNGIPADVLTPSMDWNGYRLLYLPNLALMTDKAQERIIRTLEQSPQTQLVAEGSFGMYSDDGQSSYRPPEGFADAFGVRVPDFSQVTALDIENGMNVLKTEFGDVPITTPCGYAVLEPRGDTKAIASLDGQTLGVRTADGRFTWYGLTLSAGFGDVGSTSLVLGTAERAGVSAPVAVEGDCVVPIVRRSRKGGWLVFIFNIERKPAEATLRPKWQIAGATDLLSGKEIPVTGGAFKVAVEPWEVSVVHCVEG
jgi:beta-galactosidase GanA